jgi:hypothetical protein
MRAFNKWLVVFGACVAAVSALWLLGGLAGLLPTQFVAVGGESGLRMIGSFAVAGCLLAAVGSWQH